MCSVMRVAALLLARYGVGALGHTRQANRGRRRVYQQCRAEQLSSWIDRETSSSVRDDYDAVIALAGTLWQSLHVVISLVCQKVSYSSHPLIGMLKGTREHMDIPNMQGRVAGCITDRCMCVGGLTPQGGLP